MLDKCEIVDKYIMNIPNNEKLLFGIAIEKDNVRYTHRFYKKNLEDLDGLMKNINKKIKEDIFIELSFQEQAWVYNVLNRFKEELFPELKKKELDEKEVEEFVEKLTLFRWVLENETENRIYKLGWDKDELEKELIEMYRERIKKNDIKNN